MLGRAGEDHAPHDPGAPTHLSKRAFKAVPELRSTLPLTQRERTPSGTETLNRVDISSRVGECKKSLLT